MNGVNSTTSLGPFITETGFISLSVDGLGSNAVSGVIQVEKPAGATVRKAFMAGASTGFSSRVLADGDIMINGIGVVWNLIPTIPTGIASYNSLADVTSIIKPIVDASPPGRINFTITEINTLGIDGEILAVIFDDPNQTTSNTVLLLFGAQKIDGDEFAIALAEPINLADPNLKLDFGLGISFGFQLPPDNIRQVSLVDVNGQRLSSSAGGQDDADVYPAQNGALLTVGGLDDKNDNPPPLAPPTTGASIPDDELYSLLPFVKNGDRQIKINTINPSNDDNVFFALLSLASQTAVVGEGILLAPVADTNEVGTSHTVTATVQNDAGQPIQGRGVTFLIKSGPHAGLTGTGTTNAAGQISFTYTGTTVGTDVLIARMINNAGQTDSSNEARKLWVAPKVGVVITCPADIVQSNDPDNCGAVVNFTVTATGDPAPTIVCTPPSGSTFPVGTTNVLCAATNNLGSDTCKFLVTVNDSQAPTITCPANIDTVSDYSDTPVVVNFIPTATDNCPGVTVVSNPPEGSLFPVGQTIVQCTATDHAGNKSNCSFTVTVKNPSCKTPASLRDDFNVPESDGTELLVAGRYKWSHMLNHPAGGVMVIEDSIIEPGSRLPLYDYGSIVWDSLVTGGSEASLTVVKKSGFMINKNSFKLNCDTANATLKLYARMDSKDYYAGKGYELRWTEEVGIDRLDIVLVGPQYWRESVLATAKLLINPGDSITFRVDCDNRTMIGLVNDVPIVSVLDSTYKPDQWYFVIRTCKFPTTAQFDDFKVSQTSHLSVMPQRPLKKIVEMIPDKYALEQNFPNPFNPTTTFRFGIPTVSAVRLEIYNTIGQRIATLVNEELEEGSYEISWTADVTSGIYFYSLESINIAEPNKSFRDVKKMLLLK